MWGVRVWGCRGCGGCRGVWGCGGCRGVGCRGVGVWGEIVMSHIPEMNYDEGDTQQDNEMIQYVDLLVWLMINANNFIIDNLL